MITFNPILFGVFMGYFNVFLAVGMTYKRDLSL